MIFDKKLILNYKKGMSYLHKAKAMLNYCNIKVGEILIWSYPITKGIENFEKIGCFLFNIVNRDYAKKILVMLPNQNIHLTFTKNMKHLL